MTDSESAITPLAELLSAPEYQSSRQYNPNVWTAFLTKGIIQDQYLRKIPPHQSLYSLFPLDSKANTSLMVRCMKAFRMLDLKKIPDFRSKTFEFVDGLWRDSSTGRNNNIHRLALAFWLETQQKPQPKP